MTSETADTRPRLTVLITRPRPQSVATARLLHRSGHRVLIDPLLAVQSMSFTLPEPDDIAAVLLTSANGAVGFNQRLADHQVFAVGQATAAAARKRGWTQVLIADGDAATLTALVRDMLPTDAGGLLHLSGEEVKPGIAESLIAAGYDYRRVVVYRATAAAMLAPRTIQVLSEDRLDAVLLFSPRTAAIFRDLVGAAGLDDHLGGTIGLCLSDDVAARVSSLPWQDIVVAPRRTQEALLAHLESLSGAC